MCTGALLHPSERLDALGQLPAGEQLSELVAHPRPSASTVRLIRYGVNSAWLVRGGAAVGLLVG